MTALVAIALAVWGWVAPINIRVVETFDRAYENVRAYAWADPVTDAPVCTITVKGGRWEQFSPHVQQNVITHEVGHCLGLEHIAGEGIMRDATYFEFSGYDRAEFWRVHPAPYRLTLAGVAR